MRISAIKTICRRGIPAVVVILLGITGKAGAVLDPGLPPSGNFDMTQWNLRLPVDASNGFDGEAIDIDTPALSAGYENEPWFYTGPSGELIFSVPDEGAISGTSGSPRCELRETYSNGSLRNWLPQDDEGVHILNAVCTVDALIADEEVCIGQIHGKVPDTPTIMLRYDARESPPRIEVPVYLHPDGGDKEWLYFTAPALGAEIAYQLRVEANDSSCIFYCTVNGVTQSVDLGLESGDLAAWLAATFYFKAGAYYTHSEADQTTQVSFTKLELVRGAVVENVFLPPSGSVGRRCAVCHTFCFWGGLSAPAYRYTGSPYLERYRNRDHRRRRRYNPDGSGADNDEPFLSPVRPAIRGKTLDRKGALN